MYGTHTDTTVSFSSVAEATQIFNLTWPPAFNLESSLQRPTFSVVRMRKSNHVYRVGVVYEIAKCRLAVRFVKKSSDYPFLAITQKLLDRHLKITNSNDPGFRVECSYTSCIGFCGGKFRQYLLLFVPSTPTLPMLSKYYWSTWGELVVGPGNCNSVYVDLLL